jgi:hypothetical protein
MNWFKDRFKDEFWLDDWVPMEQNKIDMTRMKAYLDFAEQERSDELQPPYETYNYKNRNGKLMVCRVLVRRKNGEIVVRNQNGVNVCLTENDLF